MSVNKVILIGNVGQDPEVNSTQAGDKVANVSLATNESYKDKAGNKVDATEWHRLIFWGKPAEIIEQYVKKGSKLYVEGKIASRSYQDKEGVTKYTTEIKVSNFTFLDSKKQIDEVPF